MKQYLSVKEYEEIAIKLLNKYAKHNTSNEDAISLVMEYMMKADMRFDDKIGKRECFRVVCGKFGALYTLKNKKAKSLSLDYEYDFYGNRMSMLENVASKEKTPLEKVITKEQMNLFFECNFNKETKNMIVDKYINNMTYDNIGKKYGISKQAVNQRIKSGKDKIRNIINES
jgi:RNA polymerase sigma factor (sigma-70 family)